MMLKLYQRGLQQQFAHLYVLDGFHQNHGSYLCHFLTFKQHEVNDIEFLISALKDGTIDVISSNHQPQDIDSKNLEFDKASFGIISLQTFYSNLVELSSKISFDTLLEKFTINPRKILNINQHEIKVGSKAILTVFDENSSWNCNENTNFSKSINSPWMNWSLKGKVEGVVVGCETNIEL